MKLRFSLRALLAAMAVAALFCLWRDRPRRMAERFVAAVEEGQYEQADGMIVPVAEPIIGPQLAIRPFLSRDGRNRVIAERLPQSAGDWLAGRCFVEVRCEDFSGLGATITLTLVATEKGLEHRTPGTVTAAGYLSDPVPMQVDPIMKQQLRVK